MIGVSVNVTLNSPSQNYTHPDDHNLRTYKKFRNKCTFKNWKLYFSFAKFSAQTSNFEIHI